MKINFGNILEKNYAYTLIIPAGCVISGNLCAYQYRLRYREIPPEDQKRLLFNLVYNELLPDTEFTLHYEQHKDGRFHAHGVIKGTCPECILLMQRQINIRLGYKSDNKKIFVYKIEYNKAGWDTYCHKDILKHCELPEESPLQGAPND